MAVGRVVHTGGVCTVGLQELGVTLFFDTEACRNFDTAISTEWLCTNGLGGYASGTISGANARKYHGYLVVAAHPPVQRYVVLSRVEDRLIVGGGAGGAEGSQAGAGTTGGAGG